VLISGYAGAAASLTVASRLRGRAGVVVIAWLYLPLGAGIETETVDMGGGQMMTRAPPQTPGYVALIFLMWAIMSIHKAT
jgi:hypothetical protein